jgi:hypothetical protein
MMNMNRALKPVAYILAGLYFTVDVLFVALAKPIADWLSRFQFLNKLRDWIISLRPYPSLFLFILPLIVLEPVKPVSLYLAGTGHVAFGATVFVVGEILKLILVERLFRLTREKLMSIPAFAWGYGKYQFAKNWVTSLEAWQTMRRWTRVARHVARGFILTLWPSRQAIHARGF